MIKVQVTIEVGVQVAKVPELRTVDYCFWNPLMDSLI